MKHLYFTLILLQFWYLPSAQNVGIGVPAPVQKLEVDGAIKIGTTATNQAGAIRYNAGKFEGGDGANWKSLEGTVSGVVGTKIYNNTDLINAGYSLFGEMPGVSTYNTSNTTFTANTWQPIYLRGIVGNVSAPPEKLPGEGSDVAVSTGSLLYVATSSKLYSYNPITDVWTIVSNQGVNNRSKAVWTGTEIIFSTFGFAGSRYNPATNMWATLPATNAPSLRGLFTMVWDGTRVIIWGGSSSNIPVNTGAMYNPSTNTWTTMNTVGAPAARYYHTAVWNNNAGRMIVWGGETSTYGVLNTGGIFNPATNSWTGATNSVGAPALRTKHTAIWTGTEMIIFGGVWTNPSSLLIELNDGFKYNYSTNTWTLITMTLAPSPRYNHSAIWTGTQMFVSGGIADNSSLRESYTYNPLTNVWTGLPRFNNVILEGKDSHDSFLAGDIIMIYGGINNQINQPSKIFSNTGYRYFLANTASSSTKLTNETLYLYQKN